MTARENERARHDVLHDLRLMYPKGMTVEAVQRIVFAQTGDMPGRVRVNTIMRPLIDQQLVGVRAGLYVALAPGPGAA